MKKVVGSVIGALGLWAYLLAGEVLAQGPVYTGTLEFTWEVYTETVAAPDLLGLTNQCIFEVRQDGLISDWLTTEVPDCEPILDGDPPEPVACGSPVPFSLSLPLGQSVIWVRCGWFFEYPDRTEVTFMDLEPPSTKDGDHFWLWDEVFRPTRILLPLIMKNATP